MGKHDREHKGDGEWPKEKPLPKDNFVQQDDDRGKHSGGQQEGDKHQDDDNT